MSWLMRLVSLDCQGSIISSNSSTSGILNPTISWSACFFYSIPFSCALFPISCACSLISQVQASIPRHHILQHLSWILSLPSLPHWVKSYPLKVLAPSSVSASFLAYIVRLPWHSACKDPNLDQCHHLLFTFQQPQLGRNFPEQWQLVPLTISSCNDWTFAASPHLFSLSVYRFCLFSSVAIATTPNTITTLLEFPIPHPCSHPHRFQQMALAKSFTVKRSHRRGGPHPTHPDHKCQRKMNKRNREHLLWGFENKDNWLL